jgi:TolB-like protein/Flp pilus assembly protein TadD
MNDILQRLHERKLVQWALAYAAAAFALLQGVDIIAQRFGWPESIERALIIAVAIGFFTTLILAWYHGEKGAQRISGTELLILALLLAVGGGLMWRVTKTPGEMTADRPDASAAAKPVQAAPVVDKSIAVLPFANLSEDKANAYFADGIQDEILTRLAKIGTLKVISRTSTLRYAAHPDDLKEIARQLGVANILEGSVQKAADAVRVNVQLIRADGDSHLWAETYDRKLDNVFGVESEVATAIANALDAKLSGAEKAELARKPTTNTEAWEAYLRGLALSDRPDLESADQIEAAKSFEGAVRLDPDFAVAWAALSIVDAGLVFTESDDTPARREAAHSALAQAVRLSPDAYETRRAQAYQAYFIERDYDGARAILEQIRLRAPSDAEVPRALALIARRQGRWDESDRLFNEALDLDPRNLKVLMWAADNQLARRRFPTALRLLGRFNDIAPGDNGALGRQSNIHMAMGDLDSAEADIARMHKEAAEQQKVLLLLLRHRYADGTTIIRKLLAETDPASLLNHSGLSYELGEFLRLSGDAGGAKASYLAARDDAKRLGEQQPSNVNIISTLAICEAALGNREAALSLARKAIAFLPASKDALNGPYYEEILVRIQARFGDKDSAIAGLQHLLTTPFGFFFNVPLAPASLRLDPGFDNLHDDPRFRKLAEMPDALP